MEKNNLLWDFSMAHTDPFLSERKKSDAMRSFANAVTSAIVAKDSSLPAFARKKQGGSSEPSLLPEELLQSEEGKSRPKDSFICALPPNSQKQRISASIFQHQPSPLGKMRQTKQY